MGKKWEGLGRCLIGVGEGGGLGSARVVIRRLLVVLRPLRVICDRANQDHS